MTDAKRILSRRDLDFLLNEWLEVEMLEGRNTGTMCLSEPHTLPSA